MIYLETNLTEIATIATDKQTENENFRAFLTRKNSQKIDELVFEINNQVTPKIDCTQCGNCCKSFMINVSLPEAEQLATHLQIDTKQLKEKYLEESLQGNLIMKSIPCSFLKENKCTIYNYRFSGCREFPHLDRPNFTDRLFGTLTFYATCPIIFNVVEELKIQVGFKL